MTAPLPPESTRPRQSSTVIDCTGAADDKFQARILAFEHADEPAEVAMAKRVLDLAEDLQLGKLGSPGMGVVAYSIRAALRDPS